MLLYGSEMHPALCAWASQRLGIADFGPSSSMGVAHKGAIVAVAIFNNYRQPNIEVTFVTSSPRWASPHAVREIISYPFRQLGCKRITAVTESTNKRARAFLCRLGFREEGVHPDALPTGDAVTYGLLRRDAARWLAEEYISENAVAVSSGLQSPST